MADNAAILAAQAQAGQAGVQAYQTAQAELERRRQLAIQQAMDEARLRGAAPISAEAAALGIGDESGSRLNQLAQDRATYESNMAARAQRMNDYSNAVQSARGLLGEQVQLAVAPINAQSAADVAKIDAQTKAALALAQAQARRGGGGGGGGYRSGGGSSGTKVTAGQVQAMAQNIAGQVIGPKVAQAQAAYQAQQRVEPDAQPLRQQVQMDTAAATYIGKAMQEQAQKDAARTAQFDVGVAFDPSRAGLPFTPASSQPFTAENAASRRAQGGGGSGVYTPQAGRQVGLVTQSPADYYSQARADLVKNIAEQRSRNQAAFNQAQQDALQRGAALQALMYQQVDIPGAGPLPYYAIPNEYSATGTIPSSVQRDEQGLPINVNLSDMRRLGSSEYWRDTMSKAIDQLRGAGYRIPYEVAADALEPTGAGIGSYGDYLAKRDNTPTEAEQASSAEREKSAAEEQDNIAFENRTGMSLPAVATASKLGRNTILGLVSDPKWNTLISDANAALLADNGVIDMNTRSFLSSIQDPKMRALISAILRTTD